MLRKLLFLTCVTGLFYLAGVAVPTVMAQTATLKGTITDAKTGETVPSANVFLVENQRGAASDAQGNYEITDIPVGTYTLRVTFIGYQPYSKKVTLQAGTNTVNVELKQGAIGLGQLVVTGYGSQTEKSLTTAVSHVSAADIQDVPVQSAAGALQGRATGVMITTTSGAPGGGFRVRVRGTGSINAGSTPLYIVDGVQISFTGQSGLADQSPLNAIAPQDIESMSVLKSAAATAIYGAQGANGVVIITTKDGQKGTPTVTASYQRGARAARKNVQFMNRDQYLEWFKRAANNTYGSGSALAEAFLRGSLIPRYGLGNIIKANPFDPTPKTGPKAKPNYYDGPLTDLPSTNWVNFNHRIGIQNKYRMSISGGNDLTTYRIGGGYQNLQGDIKSYRYQKYNLATAFKFQVSSKFSADIGLNLSNERTDGACQDGYYINCPVSQEGFLSPIATPYDSSGNFSSNLPIIGASANPALIFRQQTRFTSIVHILGHISATYDFAPWISLKTLFGEDWKMVRDESYRNLQLAPSTDGSNSESIRMTPSLTSTTTLHINKSFNEDHNLSVLLGFDYRRDFYRYLGATGHKFPGNFVSVISTAAEPNNVGGLTEEYRNAGYFGRINYNYKQRYFLSLSGRYAGSSRFGRNDRWGFFPAISAAWDISSESFLQNVDWISTLKLRAGYGVTGNSQIGRYAALGLYNVSGLYNRASGLFPNQLANPDLTWETAKEIDAGVDIGFFGNRLTASLDFYTTNHTDLLLREPLPTTSGYKSIIGNVGKVNNKGVEFKIKTINIQRHDFRWTTTFNVSIQKNTIKQLVGKQKQLYPGSVTPFHVNHAIHAYKMPIWAGVNPADGRPMYYDKDWNLTYTPEQKDWHWYDGADQDAYGGFGTSLSYKGLSARVFFQYSYGQMAQAQSLTVFSLRQIGATQGNGIVQAIKYSWQRPGQFAKYPYPMLGATIYPGSGYYWSNFTSQTLYDATYLRLKNATIAYNLPQKWISTLHLENVQIFMTGLNLLTWTSFIGFDPEVAGDGNSVYGSRGSIPASRVINGGIRVKF